MTFPTPKMGKKIKISKIPKYGTTIPKIGFHKWSEAKMKPFFGQKSQNFHTFFSSFHKFLWKSAQRCRLWHISVWQRNKFLCSLIKKCIPLYLKRLYGMSYHRLYYDYHDFGFSAIFEGVKQKKSAFFIS